jgi:hypothetical protein
MKTVLYTLLLSVVLLLGCDSNEVSRYNGTKLDYYVESYDLSGTDLGFTPQLQVKYQYDGDKLRRYTVFGYNPDSKAFEEQRYFDFSYVDDQVFRIRGYLPAAGTHYIEYVYEYLPDGRVLKITETNSGTEINSEANFAYNDTEETVRVAYTFSNGGAFEYEFHYVNDNIVNDRTTRGAQLCSDGVYTYDENRNPFNELGYVDYVLSNLSANNKLTEDINYVGCAFPSFVPESYTYEYNENGYPTVATTHFSSGGKSEKKFSYR